MIVICDSAKCRLTMSLSTNNRLFRLNPWKDSTAVKLKSTKHKIDANLLLFSHCKYLSYSSRKEYPHNDNIPQN